MADPAGWLQEELPLLAAPRIAIVVVNYNYGRFLERAIESAVGQSYPCQVVVVDDGSSDESCRVLARWERRVHVERRTNGGQRAAYNTGFACSDGDVLLFLDSDDYLAADAAETIAKAFTRGVAKVHFRMSLVDAAGRPLGGVVPNVLAAGDVGASLRKTGILYASAPGSGNAYRRAVLARLFPLPAGDEDPVGADFFTIYGAPLFGQVAAIERVLGAYRVHKAQLSAQSFVLGNAAQLEAEVARVAQRRRLFRDWIAERTGSRVLLPERLHDFSEAKAAYVRALTEHRRLQRLVHGTKTLPRLLRTLWRQSERPLLLRGALSAWGVAVLLLPRRIADPAVRYVANPASRGAAHAPLSALGSAHTA
jgi:glycosyltransferase involved in cell wall biosynthesis